MNTSKPSDLEPFQHGEEGRGSTHHACNKHIAEKGGLTRCCACSGQTDCEDTPKPADWEERFEILLYGMKLVLMDYNANWQDVSEAIKGFIREELAQKRSRTLEEMRKKMGQTRGVSNPEVYDGKWMVDYEDLLKSLKD